MRTEAEVNRAIDEYADMVRRISFMYLKNQADTEDIFQNVFLKYLLYPEPFAGAEHEKAWLIRISINACKDLLKSAFRRSVPLDAIAERGVRMSEGQSEMTTAVLGLPKKYKEVIYLFYYERYTAVEIAEMTEKPVNTVYSLLGRARDILKKTLGGEAFEK